VRHKKRSASTIQVAKIGALDDRKFRVGGGRSKTGSRSGFNHRDWRRTAGNFVVAVRFNLVTGLIIKTKSPGTIVPGLFPVSGN